jgi:hypothetical protein
MTAYQNMTTMELLESVYPDPEDLADVLDETWAIGRDFVESFNETAGLDKSMLCAEDFIKAGGKAEAYLREDLIRRLTLRAQQAKFTAITKQLEI